MKTTTVDTSGGNSHLREVAEESGVDYMEYHSSEKTETIEGHKVESWYDEGGCKWRVHHGSRDRHTLAEPGGRGGGDYEPGAKEQVIKITI